MREKAHRDRGSVLLLAVLIFSALLVASCSPREKEGLIACWRFDEGKGDRLLDASGNDNHGRIHGATWTDGRFGGGLRFDGVDDYVQVPRSASLNSISKEITLMCWIKSPLAGRYTILERWPCGRSNQRCLELDVDSEGKCVNFALSPDGTPGMWHKRPASIPAGRWVHIAATCDGKAMRIYVNGKPDPSPLALNDPRINISTSDLRIGAWYSGNTWSCFFKGIMDDIRIYSRALTHEEIHEHYRKPRPKGVIAGKVFDVNGKPVRGASVRMGLLRTTTDREGRYKITVPAGTREMVFSRKGYRRGKKPDVRVKEGETTEVDIALTEDRTAPSISELKIRDADDVSVAVVWETDEACTGTLRYGTSSRSYDKVVEGTSYVKSYRIILTGLIPNTKYYFTVESEDKGENTVKSKEQTFSTPATDDPQLVARRLENSMKVLLKLLDLDRPGLEKVKDASDDPAKAAKELLAYYRARKSVKHFIDRADRAKSRGKYAGKRQMKAANDALKHILIPGYGYPPHFRGKDIDWSTKPVPDHEWLWGLHRMPSWDALARAYWHTGDEKYVREWYAQLLDWIRKNPRNPKDRYAWRRLEVGARGCRWTEHFQHFLDSPSFTAEMLAVFLNSCHEHASYLVEGFTGGNHGLIEARGAGYIAIMFPEFKDAGKWRDKVIRHLNDQIKEQVRRDGHQMEQTLNYHNLCIRMFSDTWELARINGLADVFGDDYARRLEKMVEVLMKLGLPDGSSAQFGDTSSPFRVRPVLEKWAGVFDRKDFLYVATAGKKGSLPKQTAYALADSGFYSMRSGWDENAICLILKCGHGGFFHCQPDNGTFELYAAGRRLMPDSGTYIYHGNPAGRRWFRQTRVHQTLTLDGNNTDYKPALRLWKPGKDLDALVVENAGYENLTHRRAVLFVKKKFFVLVDEALGKAGGDVDLHFQLAPVEAVFDRKTPLVRTDFKKGANVLIRGMAQKRMSLRKEKGQVSFKYGQKQPRPAFRFRIEKSTRTPAVRFVTLVVPYEGAVPETEVSLVGSPAPGASRIELDVTVGSTTARIGYDLKEKKAWLR
ncbi:MAG: heparinase II/III family protein [Phycisphaerae bacterium]|nr:heparinase II/III family protein [Phycisphaerae bacterium]